MSWKQALARIKSYDQIVEEERLGANIAFNVEIYGRCPTPGEDDHSDVRIPEAHMIPNNQWTGRTAQFRN